MNDTINRQAAINALCAICGDDCDKSEFVYNAPQDEQVILCPEHYCLCTLPPAQPEWNGWVHIDDIYRLISGHSNYHGDNILAALTCLAEGKEVLKPISVLDTQFEQKKGKWIDNTYCSECGWVNQVEPGFVGSVEGFNFCPNCGIKIKENDD